MCVSVSSQINCSAAKNKRLSNGGVLAGYLFIA